MSVKRISFLWVFIAALLVWAGAASGKPSHLDREKNPRGCAGCHSMGGAPGTPLLKSAGMSLCFECHGSHKPTTIGRDRAKTDIEGVFAKRSKHPVYETEKYHFNDEDLPEKLPSQPRHVSCHDCHVTHVSSETSPWAGSKGYAKGRVNVNRASKEYEVCYLCHSDSENRPMGAKNKKDEFDPINESYHPIEASGREKFIPSLVRGLTVNSKITCSDCHGNNDPSGPRGPHGSDYSPLLVAEYKTYTTVLEGQRPYIEDFGLSQVKNTISFPLVVESPRAYELCYMCHDRRSILDNESFSKHYLHIVSQGATCNTCHTPHGSRDNKHLISFDSAIVSISNTTRYDPPQYKPYTTPQCYLRCHNTDHNEVGVFRTNPNGTETELTAPGTW